MTEISTSVTSKEHGDKNEREGLSHSEELKFKLRSIGVGTMRTSATYAALIIQLEDSRQDRIDVIDSVLEELQISPEEILMNRKRHLNPDSDGYAEWEREMDKLEHEGKQRGLEN